MTLAVSIIVPSHNRRPRLLEALAAIAQQRFALESVEVIVVADGCRDGTAQAVRELAMPCSLAVIELPGVGPAAARNAGAEIARAPLLLFLDDDVEPLDGWLAAHVAAHQQNPDAVVLGSYPPVPAGDGEFRTSVRHWWMSHFDRLEEAGHRFSYQDVLTGNISLSSTLWRSLGGLDPAFAYAREDGEFGIRLICADIAIVHAPAALAWHHEHETQSLAGSLRRKHEEGRSDVRLGNKHPHVKPKLDIVHDLRQPGLNGRLIRAAFRWPRLGRPVVRVAGALSECFSAVLLGPPFHKCFNLAQKLAYVLGAAQELRTMEAWRRFATATPPAPHKSISVDLSSGIPSAEDRLDAEQPDEVRLMNGPTELGWLPFAPATEPWRGRHLIPYLTRALAYNLLQNGVSTPTPGEPNDAALQFVGTRGYLPALHEGLSQWSRSGL